jgi:3-hydroxyisobutyrate dehydrogenase
MRIAMLGLGRMGAAFAGHVLDAGHDLVVWNRTPGRAAALVERGAREAPSPAAAAAEADVVVTVLFGPDSVREVLLGEDGAAGGAAPGTLVVDASTIGVDAAIRIGTALAQRGLRFVDAPVIGSVGPATAGTLGVVAGGSAEDVAQARPLLELWGEPERVRHVGDVGAGSAMKLVVNTTLGTVMAGVGEALRLAHDLALEREAVLDVLGGGTPVAFTVGLKREMLAAEDYAPPHFTLDLLVKDLELALAAGRHDLPSTRAALEAARAAVTAGHGPEDFAALAGHLAFEGSANSH